MNKQKGFTLIELLVVVAIIGILSGIAFVSISGARESAYDTQIRSELSQIRSNAEQYYYGDGDGSYYEYELSSGWQAVASEIPACSAAKQDPAVNVAGTTGIDETTYQLAIEGTSTAQSYAAWAPLCGEEYDDGTTVHTVYYCADSEGNAGEYYEINDVSGTLCSDVFVNER